MDRIPQRQLSIVGGGILGLMAAHAAYKRGFRDITVYESPGPLNLNADTLRNHAWLQSGLLYAQTSRLAAKIMWEWGRRMLKDFACPLPESSGLFRIPDNEAAEESFCERAAFLLISERVVRIDERMARKVLGPFFKPGYIHYWVPDAPFDEALLMGVARERARALNINLRIADVTMLKEATSSSGYYLRVDSQLIESEYSVLCAGVGLLSLLEQLQVDHPLAVFRSGLLRIAHGDIMRTRLLVEISEDLPTSGLSVIQHSPTAIPPRGCLVIGSKDRARLSASDARRREVPLNEDQKLQQLVPSALLPKGRGVELRVTAGHKTEACDRKGNPKIDHWIGMWPQYPGLVASVPGKATQAMYVAERIMDRLLPSSGVVQSIIPPGQSPPGNESNYLPEPHHHSCFDGILDEIEVHPNSRVTGGKIIC
jgi:glycine/D-amino acid oxidase-like deaminating enzyme